MKLVPYVILCLVFFLGGCSLEFDATVHDEDKAVLLTKDYFNDLKTEIGIQSAYQKGHQKFKESVPEERFIVGMKSIRDMISNSTVMATGYETYGTDEAIVIFASTRDDEKKLFFRVSYLGSKSKGYKLLNFNANDRGYEHKGIYREFTNNVYIQKI
jgi:hypothetical protein